MSSGLGRLADRLDRAEPLDRVANPVHGLLHRRLRGRVRHVLQGRWLGHPVHPMLTDVAIGSWTSAWLLDLFGGPPTDRAADAFVGVGVLAAAPTAWTGWADWMRLDAPARRTGVVHATANAVASALYAGSWLARRRGNRRLGVGLGHAGATAATASAFLGGHLAFATKSPAAEAHRPDDGERPEDGKRPAEVSVIGQSSP